MKYKSELINEIIETGGHVTSTLHYQSECVETWIEEVRGAYPKLTDYEGEWLNYYLENVGVGEFPYLALTNITSATVDNCVPISFKSATLSGNTKYRDIDTGDILDTFDETKKLELVSVKVPVLKTANSNNLIDTNPNSWHIIDGKKQIIQNKPIEVQPNTTYSLFIDSGRWGYIFKCDEFGNISKTYIGNNKGGGTFVTDDDCHYVIARNDIFADVTRAHTDKMRLFAGTKDLGYTGYVDEVKSNILTTPSDLELRGIGDVQDTLDCLTGEVTQRINEINLKELIYWTMYTNSEINETVAFYCYAQTFIKNYVSNPNSLLCNSLPVPAGDVVTTRDYECVGVAGGAVKIRIAKSKLSETSENGLKNYLQQNDIIIVGYSPTESVKTVELSITNQDGESLNNLKAIEGTMYIETASETIKPLLDIEVPVEAITQNLNSFIEEE